MHNTYTYIAILMDIISCIHKGDYKLKTLKLLHQKSLVLVEIFVNQAIKPAKFLSLEFRCYCYG